MTVSEITAKWRSKCYAWYGKRTSEAIIRLCDEIDAAPNHDTRDCILCKKRIEPNGGVCFDCCEKRFAGVA